MKREGFTHYFSEPFNYLDISGYVLIIVSAVDLSLSDGEEFYEDRKNLRILVVGLLLAGLRALSSLHIFAPYRVQIQLFKQVFVDIMWFMSIVLMLIVLMAIIYGLEYAMEPDPTTKEASVDSIKNNLLPNIGLFYMFMLGENPYEGNNSIIAWFVYLTFTILVQIVALNLLIALLSETFANVTAMMQANHCRTMVSILLEISGLKMCLKNDDMEIMWLHVVRDSTEKINVAGENPTLETRVRSV